jgi:hypothetical protein
MIDLKQLTSEALIELSDDIDNELALRHGAALETVDDFIAYGRGVANTDAANATYARFALLLFRLPAIHRIAFADLIRNYTLFCTYKDARYRVTGASRLGDIWLTPNFTQEVGYKLRVDIRYCSEFSPGVARNSSQTGRCKENDEYLRRLSGVFL